MRGTMDHEGHHGRGDEWHDMTSCVAQALAKIREVAARAAAGMDPEPGQVGI